MRGTLLSLQVLLVVLLVFVVPLLVFPLGRSYFELPKVIAVEALIVTLLMLRVISESKKNFWDQVPLLRKIHPLALIFTGLILVVSVIGVVVSPAQSTFFGNVFRLQGVFLLWHLLIFALISADISFKQLHRLIYNLFPLILLIFTVLTLTLGITSAGRAVATLGEPNSLAAVALFFGTFVLFKGKLWEKIPASLFTFAIILLSGSRSGLLAFIAVAAFILLCRWKFLGVKRATVVMVIFIFTSLSLPFMEGGGWFENRGEIWQTAYLMGEKAPLLGNGFGNIQASLEQGGKILNNNIQYQVVDSSHNIFLDFWVQGGVLGLVSLIMLVGLSLYNLAKSKNRLMIALLLGLITTLSFNPLSVVVLLMFWWAVGQGLVRGGYHEG